LDSKYAGERLRKQRGEREQYVALRGVRVLVAGRDVPAQVPQPLVRRDLYRGTRVLVHQLRAELDRDRVDLAEYLQRVRLARLTRSLDEPLDHEPRRTRGC